MSLFDVDLDELRTRTSQKWRRYPPDVLPLFVAEMDVRVCEPVVTAVMHALHRGDTGYVDGRPYQEAFAGFAERRWGWSVDPATAVLMPDVMQGVAELVRLLTDADGAVVINPPVYPPFRAFVRRTGRRVETADLGADGRLDLAALDEAFTRARAGGRSAAYLLCHPQNPTGAVHTPDELRALGELAVRHGVRVVSDEVHAPLVLDPDVPFVSATTVVPDAVALHSASKAFHLAGLKAALAVPGPDAAAHLDRLPATILSEVGHVPVLAHTAALTHGDAWLDALLDSLRDSRAHLRALLDEHLPRTRWTAGAATYFAWLDLRDEIPDDDDPAARLLRDARVALNPGPSFGRPGAGFARLNFATSRAVLTEAVGRVVRSLRA
ncbi:MalY/PatB family protein [Cellulomonas palmilytica]|uniref:MalY/PatB family protein n=1 Tax=Cellulomonas palmilytica TaxID=2608402 RepID=UPI001F48FBB3|nr:aminotransferase class I/II-fold pyridoxal phosphate-dependent enzyme [Cellulomonas palmilytica]UJP40712.1 aminotransferase class I/II-fold pyridoxal phosphate-dependent enzyme [Cellulomonas palmilytica]